MAKNRKPPHNFGGLPAEYTGLRNSNIVVLPVPFDRTSSWIKGSDRGPEAIISASGNMELYDIETGSEIYTQGIHTAKFTVPKTSRAMVDRVRGRTAEYLGSGKFVVVLGGEHTVSLGPIMAHAEHFPDVSILHLDAHSDRRDAYEGNPYSHACVMARAAEVVDNIVSVGIRSMDSSELKNIDKKRMFCASDIHGKKGWTTQVVKKLSKNVYVTIDLDVFDPSVMPSTGTPEPGGMGWYEVLGLLEHVIKHRNVVGFDVVELCPSPGNPAPDFLAAKLIYKLLSLRFA